MMSLEKNGLGVLQIMDKITIIVEATPPSNNKFIGRTNKFEYQRYKKTWAMLVRSGMKDIPKEPFERSKVHIHYTFPTRTRRDPDNFSGKMILDPLVSYGIIADDSFKKIELVLSAEYKKGISETKITIERLK